MRILVTGAAGFLGHHVTNALDEGNNSYIGIDNFDPLCGSRPSPRVLNYNIISGLFKKFLDEQKISHIIHLAAYGRNLTCQDHPHEAWSVNVNGTRNILQSALELGLDRVIVCSSNITLSPVPTVYKSTKVAVESLVEMYHSLGLNVMGIRPSNIYGAGQSKTEYQPCAFAGMDKSIEERGYVRITGDGSQSRDWVHAADVAEAFVKALFFDGLSGQTFDICTGRLTSVMRVVQMLGADYRLVDPRPGDAEVIISEPNIAWEKMGWNAKRRLSDHVWEAFPSIVRPHA